MLGKCSISIKSPKHHVSRVLFLLLLWTLNTKAFADPRIDRNFLKLPDGRWIWLKKLDEWTTRIIIGKGAMRAEGNSLWSKDYSDDEHRTWAYAYFAYLKPRKLLVDLDHDGSPEVGVATYDLGTSMRRTILIFSIQGNQLVMLREHGPINLASDESAYK
jgi:hypothetical protein